jgi:hypothetical protein
MLSTPQPIPHSMRPDLILEAMMETASKPLEHNLLLLETVTSIGKSAIIKAALAIKAPAPGMSTLPTQISSINLGSSLVLLTSDLNTWASISSGFVLLRPPTRDFVRGVLKQATMTTSSGFFTQGLPKLEFLLGPVDLLIWEIRSIGFTNLIIKTKIYK